MASHPPDEKKQTRRVLFWVGALAAAVRLLYFGEHAGSAFFGVPILDEKFYDTIARSLAAGLDFSTVNPGFRPLLYPLFLASLYHLGGEWGFVLAVLAQHLLGIATAVLIAALAIRLHRRAAAGALGGGLYALAGPPLYFEGELLITALFTFLVTALLWVLSRADLAWKAAPWWLAAGLLTGLAAQARPNVLLLLAAFPAAAVLFRRSGESSPGVRDRVLLPALAVAGAGAMLLAFAAGQSRWIGRFQLLPSAGGINFYLGNKAGADGMIPRQDESVTYGEEYRDSVQVFAVEHFRRELGPDGAPAGGPAIRPIDPAAVSRYWTSRTLDEIRGDPRRWLGLMGRKLLYLAWNREIPNNKNYAFIRDEESPLLRRLPVRWWMLLSLAALGFAHARGRGDGWLLYWTAAWLALYALGLVLFFVNSRYRIPMWPAMAILAAGALPWLAELRPLGGRGGNLQRRRAWHKLAAGAAAVAAIALLSLPNWLAVPPQGYGRDFFFRSLAHLEKGDLEAAEADARKSVELDAGDAAAHFQLGNTALAAGHFEVAFTSYMAAGSLAPDEPRIFNNLGILYERRDRPAAAYRSYLAAVALVPDYAPALVNAALLELRAGLADRAEEKLRRAADLGFDSVELAAARREAVQRPLRPADIGARLE